MNKLSKLDKDSRNWLIAALDPYHDNQLDLEGLPDERSAPSVVQMHNQSYTLNAPAIAAGGNWCAKVSYTGFDCDIDNIPGIQQGYALGFQYDSLALSAGAPFGAFVIQATDTAHSFKMGAPVVAGETHVAFGSVKGNAKCRLIAVACEIHNTTAQVYKQGSVTTAMLPDPSTDGSTALYHDTAAGGAVDSCLQADRSAQFSASRGDLMAVPSSGTWDASEGVYFVPRMTRVPHDLQQLGALGQRVPVVTTKGDANSYLPNPYQVSAVGAVNVPRVYGTKPSGFSPVEAAFEGLSNQSTLVVTMRTIVEYFPALDSALLPLSSPSPMYDPKALSIYSGIVKEAPYAVKVGENSAGDYFRRILLIAGKVAPVVAPFTGAFAPAVVAGGALAERVAEVIAAKTAGRRIQRGTAGSRAAPTRR